LYSIKQITIISFIPLLVDTLLICFHMWAIMNKASVDVLVQVLGEHKFSFLFGNY
jgi:hypothetical protein